MSNNIRRAGVILYAATDNGDVCFLLGIDAGSKNIASYTGHVEKIDKDVFHTASRELEEESLGCVNLTPERISQGIIFCEKGTMISFVKVKIEEILEYISMFDACYKSIRRRPVKTEMCGTKLLIGDELVNCVENGRIYSVDAEVLKNNFVSLYARINT